MKSAFTKVSYGTIFVCSFFVATIQSMDGMLDIIKRAGGDNTPGKDRLHSELFQQSSDLTDDNDNSILHCQFTPNGKFLIEGIVSGIRLKTNFMITDVEMHTAKSCRVGDLIWTGGLETLGRVKLNNIGSNNDEVVMASSAMGRPSLLKINVSSAQVVANFSDKVQKRLHGRLTNGSYSYKYIACNPSFSQFVTVTEFKSRETLGQQYSLCCIHDGSTGEIEASWEAGERTIENLSYSPDGRYFVLSNAENTQMWNCSGTVQRDISGPTKYIAWSPDSSRLALCQTYEGKGVVVDSKTGEVIKKFAADPSAFVSGIFFNESGNCFVSLMDLGMGESGGKTIITVYNAKTFEAIESIGVSCADKNRVVVSPDGKYLVFNGTTTLNLYDLEQHKIVDQHEHEELFRTEGTIQWVPGSTNTFLSSPLLGTKLLLWSITKSKELQS